MSSTATRTEAKIKLTFAEDAVDLLRERFPAMVEAVKRLELPEAGRAELQVVRERRTEGVPFAAAFNVDFPKREAAPIALGAIVESVRAVLEPSSRVALDGRVGALSIKQFTYGERLQGDWLVTSYYRWNAQRPHAERVMAMLEHIEMERGEPLYRSVHFNETREAALHAPAPSEFIFEGYCRAREDIAAIYAKPALEHMRKHSQGFLDTSTRQLAFAVLERLAKL